MSSADAEFDIIFAGGGTSSCLIASRLADADPSLKMLIVEAGPHTLNDLSHIQPALYHTHLVPNSKTVTYNQANPEKELGGRQLIVPSGHCVGGGSSVNFMMYTRGSASDYDDWETKYNNPGWGSNDIIPLLKKTETYEIAPGKDTHGYSGPLKVSYGGAFTNVGKHFLDTAVKYDPSRGTTDDPNGMYTETVDKYGRWQKWIDSKAGSRSDVPHNFIYNKNHKNITIITGHLVKRVVFEYKRAVGVEYTESPRTYPNTTGEVSFARARRLVVLSAGSFGSPTILERSGIGAKSVLEQSGVEQLVDLPGVGENYQDHNVIFCPYLASEDSETLDAIVRHEEPEFSKWNEQWHKDKTGLMSHNALDGGVKLRPNEQERKAIGPNFDNKWKEFYLNAPDKPAMYFGPASMLVGDILSTPFRKYFAIAYYLQYPSARGFVHIRSGDDPAVPASFETGYLKHPDDLALMKWGYKRAREYARRMPCYRGEYTPWHPQFSETSAALCHDDARPVPIDAPDIVYSEEDDKAIEICTRKHISTTWHALGTCAMKAREEGGVVDSRLNVYGVEGLKVADLSIPPSNVGANTYSTALAVAEKAAVIIGDDLGIKGV